MITPPRIPPNGYDASQDLAQALTAATGRQWRTSPLASIAAQADTAAGCKLAVFQMETVDRWEITLVDGTAFTVPHRRYAETRHEIAPMIAAMLAADACGGEKA